MNTIVQSKTTSVTHHIAVVDGQLTTTTQDVATVFGKQHAHVLKIVRQRMAEAGDWGVANFCDTPYTNPQNGQVYSVIRMTKKGFSFVVQKFTGKEAVKFQIEYIDEFERMAETLNARSSPQLATAAQKQHLKSLVSDRVSKTGLHFQKVWTAVQEANGFNRLDNLTPQSYAKSCAYFKADPIGLNPDDWAHAPVALPHSQPATFKVPDGMMLIPRTAALNLWSMAKQLTSGIDALGMIDGDMPKWLVA